MKTTFILLVCQLLSIIAYSQDSKWTLGSSASFVSWDNGQAGTWDNHIQTSFSVEIGYDLSRWCKIGLRHLIIRDRPAYVSPILLNLSGIILQAGFIAPQRKSQGYVETGFFYKNTFLIDRFVAASSLDTSANAVGFSWGVGGRYFVWNLVHLGLGLNHYIPFARLSNSNITVLVTPKLDLIYRF